MRVLTTIAVGFRRELYSHLALPPSSMSTMKRKSIVVDRDRLLEGLDSTSQDPWHYFLDLDTGEVVDVSEETLIQVDEEEIGLGPEGLIDQEQHLCRNILDNPKRYVSIPKADDHLDYNAMQGFATGLTEVDLREKLQIALAGKGAFGRFRSVLALYPDVQGQWDAARIRNRIDYAEDWLGDLGYNLRVREATQSIEESIAKRESSDATVTLLDVLLLGAPDGKTELLDGKVARVVRAKNPSDARKLFKGFARDICRWYGVEWRNKFIDGRSTFHLNAIELAVKDDWIEVQITVNPDLYKRMTLE